MKLENSFYSFAGIAAKAGACVCGAEAVDKGVKTGKILLVIADNALSQRAKKDLHDMCGFYSVPYVISEPDGMLGKSIGRENNKIVGITQKNIAERLMVLCNISAKYSEV